MPRHGRTRQQKTTVLSLVLAFAASAIVGYAGMGRLLVFCEFMLLHRTYV